MKIKHKQDLPTATLQSSSRRTALLSGVALCAASTLGWSREAYPSKAIRVVVPFPAGGGTDAAARMYGERLGAVLGQPLVIENRAGATGAIGTAAVLNSQADGYTLLIGSDSSVLLGPLSSTTKAFDPLTDLVPIALTVVNPMVLVVHPSVKANTPAELIEEAKQRRLTYASIGEGSLFHFAGEMFNHLAGVNLQHVPYKGAAPAIVDVRAGHVDAMFCTVGLALPHLQQKSLKVIAALGEERSRFLPDVPTLKESGLNDYAIESWGGIFVKTGTPEHVVSQLAAGIRKLSSDAAFEDELNRAGSLMPKLSPAEVADLLRVQYKMYGDLYKAVGMDKKGV